MSKRKRLWVVVCFALMLAALRCVVPSALVHSARAQSDDTPTTRSLTTRPADELPGDSPIRKQFALLTDPDPKVRDQAREGLMGITSDDLPKLRQLVIENEPISPGQSAALRDIVLQAFLSAEKYTIPGGAETTPAGNEGPFFLGMLWGPETGLDARMGVSVEDRLPGFPSYRYLRKGDMILGIFFDTTAPLLQFPNMETHSRQALIGAISGSPHTQDIVLQVLRDGEIIRVPVKMAPRPLDANQTWPDAIKPFTAARADRAETYWQENFAPLVEQACQ